MNIMLIFMLAFSNPQLTDNQRGLLHMQSCIGWAPRPGDYNDMAYLGLIKPQPPTLAQK